MKHLLDSISLVVGCGVNWEKFRLEDGHEFLALNFSILNLDSHAPRFFIKCHPCNPTSVTKLKTLFLQTLINNKTLFKKVIKTNRAPNSDANTFNI